jgi:nucleoside-diphosphate-sugar epimerase
VSVTLVTGAAGTIGRPLVRALRETEPAGQVIGLDRRASEEPAVAHHITAGIVGPFTVAERRLLATVTRLVHLAADIGVEPAPRDGRWTALSQPVDDLRGLIGAMPMLRHVVFASSYLVYAVPPTGPLTEADALGPINVYGWQKCALEAYLAGLGVPSCSLRLAGVYGPGCALDSGRSIASVLRALVTGEEVTLYAPGTSLRNHLYLSDAVAAFQQAVRQRWTGAVNIAGPDAVSLLDVVGVLAEIAGRPIPARWLPGEPGWHAVLDTSRAAACHRFTAHTGLHEGLRAHFAWALAGRVPG